MNGTSATSLTKRTWNDAEQKRAWTVACHKVPFGSCSSVHRLTLRNTCFYFIHGGQSLGDVLHL